MRAHANRGRSLEALGFLSMGNPVIVVLGAGPGVGGAVARRFGQAGYDGLATRLGIDAPEPITVPVEADEDPFAEPGF